MSNSIIAIVKYVMHDYISTSGKQRLLKQLIITSQRTSVGERMLQPAVNEEPRASDVIMHTSHFVQLPIKFLFDKRTTRVTRNRTSNTNTHRSILQRYTTSTSAKIALLCLVGIRNSWMLDEIFFREDVTGWNISRMLMFKYPSLKGWVWSTDNGLWKLVGWLFSVRLL